MSWLTSMPIATCSSCPLFAPPRECQLRGRIVDPQRFLCDLHPAAPPEAREGPAWLLTMGDCLARFFVLLDPGDRGVEAAVWRVEDVAGVPLVITEGRVGGERYLWIDAPGGMGLSSADVLGLAAMTSAWRDAREELGVHGFARRLAVAELFTCYALWLLPAGESWDGETTGAGWPVLAAGCGCGAAPCSP